MTARTYRDWPALMARNTAARFCDMTVPQFEREVATGTLPQPVAIGGEMRWGNAALTDAIEVLTGRRVADWREHQPGLKHVA